VAAVARAVLVGAVAADVWASDAAALGPSCGAASLQGFDVIREPSLNPTARALRSIFEVLEHLPGHWALGLTWKESSDRSPLKRDLAA